MYDIPSLKLRQNALKHFRLVAKKEKKQAPSTSFVYKKTKLCRKRSFVINIFLVTIER